MPILQSRSALNESHNLTQVCIKQVIPKHLLLSTRTSVALPSYFLRTSFVLPSYILRTSYVPDEDEAVSFAYGNIGLLAHDNLAGAYFSRLFPRQEIQIIYGAMVGPKTSLLHIYIGTGQRIHTAFIADLSIRFPTRSYARPNYSINCIWGQPMFHFKPALR